jgi:uncharacterized damage-inducible protein DinB
MNSRELLIDTNAYNAPGRSLEGLSAEDAGRRIPGAPHTIADIVAHLVYWQDWFTQRALGKGEPMAASASLGWPAETAAWPDLRARFESGLVALSALDVPGASGVKVTPPIEFPPLANYTVSDVLVHVAQHNAHHLGQVVLLRQLMALWPPPSGSWTW